ncbi:hypothetical protein [Hymenobacter cellulosilyticus]|uniref:Uncharacterized protein n=1 Tax=Hymenobacter cellulosilyticus TaxID=2932248 RepID=A0A8T9QC84_9BACT|nr:hypothetical protein [Hymenobacter cellulosilyticus]UOQ73738.1 hypothetical protein MUN79_07410 [Hymenobacter cellulosilyticus]
MENKQNQPTSGANATGTSKSANASSPQSSSANAQGAADSQNTAASTSSSSAGSSPNSRTTTSESASNQSENQDQNKDQNRSQGNQQGAQSWTNITSWLDGSKEIPQSVKDFGTKALDQVNKLSTTQKVVGGALLLGGIGWLSMRSGGKSSSSRGSYRSKPDSDYSSGKSYNSGEKDYLANYGSGNRTSASSRSGRYGSDSSYGSDATSGFGSASGSNSDYRSSSSKDSGQGYRSGSANTSASSSLGDDDYSGNL